MKRISQLPQRTRLCTLHWLQVCQVQQSPEVHKNRCGRWLVPCFLTLRVQQPERIDEHLNEICPGMNSRLGWTIESPNQKLPNGANSKKDWNFGDTDSKFKQQDLVSRCYTFVWKILDWIRIARCFPEIYTNWNCPYKLLANPDGPLGKQFRDAILDQWLVGIWQLSVGKSVPTTSLGMF